MEVIEQTQRDRHHGGLLVIFLTFKNFKNDKNICIKKEYNRFGIKERIKLNKTRGSTTKKNEERR